MTATCTTDLARAVAVAHRILGVSATATAEDVKRAYRLFAFLTHPDRNPGQPAAAAEFRTIRFAADVLADTRVHRIPAEHQLRA